MPYFEHDGLRIHFSERGDPDGVPFVMIHGLLWSGRMMRRIAGLLPDHRILLVDLRGHGESSKPTDVGAYSWSSLGSDVTALLDHLGIRSAVVGGLSLGANVTLRVALDHPDRVHAMVVEMPVLDRAETVARAVFGALAAGLEGGRPILDPLTRGVSRLPVPASVPELAALRDVLSLDPTSGAALVRGLLADELFLADLDPSVLTMPALVIAHRGDPIHVLDDARDLTRLLPDARLDIRRSIADYRVRPDLLAALLTEFLGTLPEPGG